MTREEYNESLYGAFLDFMDEEKEGVPFNELTLMDRIESLRESFTSNSL